MIEVIGHLDVEFSEDCRSATLLSPIRVVFDTLCVEIPIGYRTDFTSSPQLFWNVIPPLGKYAVAAVIHDYLYDIKIFDKKTTDKIFYDLLKQSGIGVFKSWLMYTAVKLFGFTAWSNK